MTDVVIVGASIAADAVTVRLRELDFDGQITIVADETDLPYDKPPLSKGLLTGAVPRERVALHPPEWYPEHAVDLRLGCRAVGLDAEQRRVQLADGTSITAGTAVVIATGARARRLSRAPRSNEHVVRTAQDGVRLAAALTRSGKPARVAVVGAGFIGAEVAASARKLGCDVTVIDAEELPFAGSFGVDVANALRGLHIAAGTTLRYGCPVAGVAADGVSLADGSHIPADVVVTGIGVVPNVEWLNGSGVAVADGVLCDDLGRTSVPGVYAAGDVAAWLDPTTGRHARHEHWTRAREQARLVAEVIAGMDEPDSALPPPYFWSDQYGRRVQAFGTVSADDRVAVVHGELGSDSFAAVYVRDDKVIGAVGLNAAGPLARLRPAVTSRQPFRLQQSEVTRG